ncbi:MAG: MgtC/SapB family protein [Clostridia bacterium]|nr:MgtC/SapB family protein [Clostridia bacterium]
MSFKEIMTVLRGVGIAGIAVRLILAVICGGLIGLERESKRRAAGFRTHTLICIGATLTTLVSQYMVSRGLNTDPARLGAQVIAGMGFIGAGAIIVTSRRQVKGLTTAAGLWTSAIIGLSIGTGYYEAALLAVCLVLIAELFLSKFEYFIVSTARSMNVYVEFADPHDLDRIVEEMTAHNMSITDIEFTKSRTSVNSHPSAIFSVRFRKKMPHENVMALLSEIEGVLTVEEL